MSSLWYVPCPLYRHSPAKLHVFVKFSALTGRVIHGTQFWTATNVADGLTALTICIEVRGSCPSYIELLPD